MFVPFHIVCTPELCQPPSPWFWVIYLGALAVVLGVGFYGSRKERE